MDALTLAGAVGILGALLGALLTWWSRSPRSTSRPEAAVRLEAVAGERQRELEQRAEDLEAEALERQTVADEHRAQAEAVAGDDAQAVADLMNEGRP